MSILFDNKTNVIDMTKFPQLFLNDHKHGNKFRNVLDSKIRKKFVAENLCNYDKLNKLFFSKKNVDIINKQIILNVWKKTNKQFKIGKQSISRLIIVMRWVWIQYARNLPFNYSEQIARLNCHVVDKIIPNIITNLEQKIGYLKDISERKAPLERAINTNFSQRSTLPSISNIFHD